MAIGELVFVVGLAGSGKTPYLNELAAAGWLVFDDYKARAFGNDPHFCAAPRYCELLAALTEGKSCALADMDFCCESARAQALRILADAVPGLIPRWECFPNDPDCCFENIRHGTRAPEPRLTKVAEFSPKYTIPPGARILPIRSHTGTQKRPST